MNDLIGKSLGRYSFPIVAVSVLAVELARRQFVGVAIDHVVVVATAVFHERDLSKVEIRHVAKLPEMLGVVLKAEEASP